MKEIRFLRKYEVKSRDGAIYEEGSTHRMNDASADHFLNRGVAELVGDQQEKKRPGRPAKASKEKNIGDRGGDPAKRFSDAQAAYEKGKTE